MCFSNGNLVLGSEDRGCAASPVPGQEEAGVCTRTYARTRTPRPRCLPSPSVSLCPRGCLGHTGGDTASLQDHTSYLIWSCSGCGVRQFHWLLVRLLLGKGKKKNHGEIAVLVLVPQGDLPMGQCLILDCLGPSNAVLSWLPTQNWVSIVPVELLRDGPRTTEPTHASPENRSSAPGCCVTLFWSLPLSEVLRF